MEINHPVGNMYEHDKVAMSIQVFVVDFINRPAHPVFKVQPPIIQKSEFLDVMFS